MKKIFVLLMILLLAGCSKKSLELTNKVVEAGDDVQVVALKMIEDLNEEGWSIADGIVPIVFAGENEVSDSRSVIVYPLLKDDKVKMLLVRSGEDFFVEVDPELEDLLESQTAVTLINNKLFAIRKTGVYSLEGYEKSDEDMGMIKKINALDLVLAKQETVKKTTLSAKKLSVQIDGNEVSTTRLIVTFKDGIRDEDVEEVERLCQGKLLQTSMSGVCVFEFNIKTAVEMQQLYQEVSELDSVAIVSYDGVNQISTGNQLQKQ